MPRVPRPVGEGQGQTRAPASVHEGSPGVPAQMGRLSWLAVWPNCWSGDQRLPALALQRLRLGAWVPFYVF